MSDVMSCFEPSVNGSDGGFSFALAISGCGLASRFHPFVLELSVSGSGSVFSFALAISGWKICLKILFISGINAFFSDP